MADTLTSTNLWLPGEIQFKNKNPTECTTASFKRRRHPYAQITATNILHQLPTVVKVIPHTRSIYSSRRTYGS